MATTRRAETVRVRFGLSASVGLGLLAFACAALGQTQGGVTPPTPAASAASRGQTSATLAAKQDAPSGQGQSPAQSLLIEPSVAATVTYTNNSGLVPENFGPRRDVVIDLQTNLAVHARSARFSLNGEGGLDFVTYTNATQSNRVLPRGRIELNSTLVENNVFVDASVDASRTRTDPFEAQSQDAATTANTLSVVTYRLTPSYSHEIAPNLSILARSENTWTHSTGDAPDGANGNDLDLLRDSRTQYDVLSVERKPTPLGLTIEASRQDTRYQQVQGVVLRIDTVRAIGTFAVNPELIVGAVVGHDRSTYSLTQVSEPRYGAVLHWRPDEKTRLDADLEHRFFGAGWDVRLEHRSPMAILEFSTSRLPSDSPQPVGSLPAGGDLSTLLNTLLSTRIPNVADRASAVQDLLARRGLSSQVPGAFEIFSDSAQVDQQTAFTIVLNGVRNTVTLSLFYAKAVSLDQGTVLGPTAFDTQQRGGTVDLNHALSPSTTLDLRGTWSDVRGLGARSDESAVQREYTLSLNHTLSPRSALTTGIRRLSLSGTSNGDVVATEIFVGMKVRY